MSSPLIARQALAALGVVMALGVPTQAAASAKVRIAVLPVLSYAGGVEGIYQERPKATELGERAVALQRHLEAALGALDGVQVQPLQQVQEQLLSPRGKEALEVGRERYALGQERYRGLQVEKATEHLSRARELFETAFVDVIAPKEAADVAMLEGLAVIESGTHSHALLAFRRMWTLEPTRTFERGYYPRATEEVLETALEDLLGNTDLAALRWPGERLQALSTLTDIDLWVTATVVGSLTDPSLRVRGYDVARGAVTLEVTIPLDGTSEARLDRLLSAWHACHVPIAPPSLAQARRRHAWYVDTSYAHTLMLFHKNTRDLFQSPGLAISVTWEALDFFHGYAQFSYMGSIPDPNGDLLEPFLATRLALGGGFTGGTRRLRGFFRVGFEIAISLTDIAMTQDVMCKHWGTDHPRCDAGSVFVDRAPGTWLGFVFGAGVRWAMIDSWYLVGSVELASYFADAESELIDDLNFPLSMSLGIGTRF